MPCYVCGRTNHLARDCFYKRVEEYKPNGISSNSLRASRMSPALPHAKIIEFQDTTSRTGLSSNTFLAHVTLPMLAYPEIMTLYDKRSLLGIKSNNIAASSISPCETDALSIEFQATTSFTVICSKTLHAWPIHRKDEYMPNNAVWTNASPENPVFIMCPWRAKPVSRSERAPIALSKTGYVKLSAETPVACI
ncbi:hypothetical protein RJ639_032771 [Escallonia herrerae]|uniref:CCHC-type domain-containing protein n=1 Tax=Escallonia herrerae TaxID=1293975 RepID=A0AA88WTS5_9ASTE|nr:hypothetical protein RJ639_032771 [Escallonia herrerae]